MYFKQFYLGCLAHASYMIGSDGEAAVVDPRRDVDSYIEEARAQGLEIRHIIETHLHADFVSGHQELAHRTGAKIYFGAKADAKFDYVPVREGDEIRLGDGVVLRFLETPGHTPESVSILVVDRAVGDVPKAVLTGDTLFIGDVGRPDLTGSDPRAGSDAPTAQDLAGMLYDSLHRKLLTLPDSVEVYPAHGAGSLCGRNISSETSSTIGQQRQFNYALKPMPKEEFVRMMTTDLPEAPQYFARDVAINRGGAAELAELPDPAALGAPDVEVLRKRGAIVLDTRPSAQYGAGHVPGSLHVGLSGQFASWAGALVSPKAPIVLVSEEKEQVREAQTRLARVGLDNVAGYLEGGLLEWHRAGLPLATTEQIGVEELDARIREGRAGRVVDVRRPGEWQSGHVAGAMNVPLNTLEERAADLPKEEPLAVLCAGGFRSSIGTSILERQGFARITNVVGGMAAWKTAGLEVAT
jgi:hydroxyacylglutathione hydrolase